VCAHGTEFSKELSKRLDVFIPASEKAFFEKVINLAKPLHHLVSYGLDFPPEKKWGSISANKGPTQEELTSLRVMYTLVGGALSDAFDTTNMDHSMEATIDGILKMNDNLIPLKREFFLDINDHMRSLTQVTLSMHVQWDAVLSFLTSLDVGSKDELHQKGHDLIEKSVDYYYGETLGGEWKNSTINPKYKALSRVFFGMGTQPFPLPQPQIPTAFVPPQNGPHTPVVSATQPGYSPFNDDVFTSHISDHKAFVCNYPGMPVVSWNTWAKGTRNGFNSVENDQGYVQQRYPKVLQQLRSLRSPHASVPIIALQEISGAYADQFKADSEKGSTWHFDAMTHNVTGDSFRNAIIYDSTLYTVVPGTDSQVTNALNSAVQTGRFQHITVTNKMTHQATDLINVHLKWGTTTPQQLSDALIAIQGACKVPTIVIGDFNMDLRHLVDPRLHAHTIVDGSRVWKDTQSTKNTTDGYVILYPQTGMQPLSVVNPSSSTQVDMDAFITTHITGRLQAEVHQRLLDGRLTEVDVRALGAKPFNQQSLS
jgi:hypothetical protein